MKENKNNIIEILKKEINQCLDDFKILSETEDTFDKGIYFGLEILSKRLLPHLNHQISEENNTVENSF